MSSRISPLLFTPLRVLTESLASLLHSSPVCIVLRQTSSNPSSCFSSGSVVHQGYNQLAKTRIQTKLLWWTSCYFWSITDVTNLCIPPHQRYRFRVHQIDIEKHMSDGFQLYSNNTSGHPSRWLQQGLGYPSYLPPRLSLQGSWTVGQLHALSRC